MKQQQHEKLTTPKEESILYEYKFSALNLVGHCAILYCKLKDNFFTQTKITFRLVLIFVLENMHPFQMKKTYFSSRNIKCTLLLVSTYVVCERLSVMHKQVSGWTVNFCPNSPDSPFLEFQTRKPLPPFRKTSDLRWPKFTLKYPPNFRKLQI